MITKQANALKKFWYGLTGNKDELLNLMYGDRQFAVDDIVVPGIIIGEAEDTGKGILVVAFKINS